MVTMIRSRWPSALTRLPATLEVTGSRPHSGGISEINFSGRQVSSTEGRETVCVILQDFTVIIIIH
jgi:hypothetical protein